MYINVPIPYNEYGSATERSVSVHRDDVSSNKEDSDYKQFIHDIASRREFRTSRQINVGESKKTHKSVFGKHTTNFNLSGLQLHETQRFVENFINPNTTYSRILLNWQTGSGKTIGALSIAQKFVENFKMRKNLNIMERPTVFVIGFTQNIIQDAMLKHPSFVSPKEILMIESLKKANNMKEYMLYVSSIKRRFTNKKKGGYYNFIGYREFSNRLFKITDKGILHNFSIQDLYNTATRDDTPTEKVDHVFEFHDAVSKGYLEINTELVNQMRNSLLVLDEIHNTYNMQSKNNYGIALQYILDYLEDQGSAPSVVFMSATIMSGNVTEIVSFLNLLIPRYALPNKIRLTNDMFFIHGKLIPGAAKRIGELTAGRVSFLMENSESSEDYPERIFVGESISFNGHNIPYLKFTPCPMSKLHYNTLQHYITTAHEPAEYDRIAISIADQTLYDMVYPNPDSDSIGLYNSTDTLHKIMNAQSEWKEKKEVSVLTSNTGNPTAVIGGCLNIKNIGIYSSKYEKLIKDLVYIIKHPPTGRSDTLRVGGVSSGKIMINHTWVKMSGVNQIQEILLENGFLDEVSVPRSNTLCNTCGISLKDHNILPESSVSAHRVETHTYSPCRFVIIHSDFDKNTINRSIAKFNDIDNVDGSKIRILIGSKLISESYDFNSIRYQFIMSSPINISTLIQIFGRVARRGSHKLLPLENRNVKIYIYISTGPKYQPELERYYEKMLEYISIQEINKYIRIYAVDMFIGTTMSTATQDSIDHIKYNKLVNPTELSKLDEKTSTYYAYKYSTAEIIYIKSIILKLFDIQIVWIYEDLLNAIRTGYIENTQTNFTEGNILVALDQLIMYNKRVIYNLSETNSQDMENNKFRICRLDKYYIKFPVNKYNQPIIDIESYLRENTTLKTVYININNYLNTYKSGKNFDIKLKEFINEFSYAESRIINTFVFYDEDFHYSMLKYIIIESVKNSDDIKHVKQVKDIYELYKKYKIIITTCDILNGIYNCSEIHDTIKDIPNLKKIGNKTEIPVGFITSKFIMMYDTTTLKWYEISRSLFNIKNRFEENDIVVGYIEKKKNGLKFKVRPPLHTLSISDDDDSRSLLRGAVCETRTREEQIKLVDRLKLMDKKLLKGFNSFEICQLILVNLLNLEQKSRSQKNGLSTSIRWFYLFNDPLPAIASNISS